jgi:hypothetical protein
MTEQATVETTAGKPEPIPSEAAALFNEVENGIIPEPGQEGAEPDAAGGDIPTAEMIRPLISLGFATLAPAWKVSEQEQAGLTEAYAAVIDKYFPGGLNLGPEMAALLVTAGIVLPRLNMPRKEPEPEGGDSVET